MAGVGWTVARLATVGVAAGLLAGCGGPSGDKFPPVCPRPAILADSGILTRYRGSGRDFLDTVLQGEIEGLQGSCTQDNPKAVATTVSVNMRLTRGPAATSREFDVPFFVAVTKGNQILDKQVYVAHAVFPENTDRLRLTGDKVDLLLPVAAGQKADIYEVTVGFQLTSEELQTNRATRPRR